MPVKTCPVTQSVKWCRLWSPALTPIEMAYNADAAHWLVASGEPAIQSCRAITLILHLCHIVGAFFTHTPVFDLCYLLLFKAVGEQVTYMIQIIGQNKPQ